MPEVDIEFRATPSHALEFLTKLARDNAFREQVSRNHVAMLAAYNIHIKPVGWDDEKSLSRGPTAPADRVAAFGDWSALCKDRVQALEEVGYKHKGFLPPKHVIEEALVNIPHANEFGPPTEEFTGIDPFGFFLLLPLVST